MKIIAALLLISTTLAIAEQPKIVPPTIEGTVVDAERLHRIYGEYTISTPALVYLVEEKLVFLQAPAHITVNGTVKFYIVANKMHFIDNDGKFHTASIVRQEANAENAVHVNELDTLSKVSK